MFIAVVAVNDDDCIYAGPVTSELEALELAGKLAERVIKEEGFVGTLYKAAELITPEEV